MNPFDWRGPQFLAFFAGCIAVVLLAIWWLRRVLESHAPVRMDVADPYQLAFLREGPVAAVEVALVSLIDRGLLAPHKDTGIVQTDPRAGDVLRRPFEKAVFANFEAPGRRLDPSRRALAISAKAHCEGPLQQLGLLASAPTRLRRWLLALAGVAALWSIAGTKIWIALGRGHSNIELLIVFAVVGSALCLCFVDGRTTVAGRQMVASLRGLFARLPERARQIRPGGGTNEMSVLAALFGVAAVPSSIFPHRDVIRRPARRSKSSGNSACGSVVGGCGSVVGGCGSGGGSGCGSGGGGGGGGCGSGGGSGCGSGGGGGGGGCGGGGGGGCGGCGS